MKPRQKSKPGFRHIFLLPSNGGEPRQLTKGDFHHISGDPPLALDGQSIVVSALIQPDAHRLGRDADLFVFSTAGGEPRRLTEAKGIEDLCPLRQTRDGS